MANNQDRCSSDYHKHLMAAKEWIGQAEESIEQENEIRSDLNLMLAQAELQRAKERNSSTLWKKWLKWTVPWIAAVGIAMFYVWILRPEPAKTVVQDTAIVKRQEPVEREEYRESHISTDMIKKQEISEDDVYREQEPPMYQEKNIEVDEALDKDKVILEDRNHPKIAVSENTIAVADKPVVNESNVPSEDMQRLMQLAGRVLRE